MHIATALAVTAASQQPLTVFSRHAAFYFLWQLALAASLATASPQPLPCPGVERHRPPVAWRWLFLVKEWDDEGAVGFRIWEDYD